jgi:hypothetical protein
MSLVEKNIASVRADTRVDYYVALNNEEEAGKMIETLHTESLINSA